MKIAIIGAGISGLSCAYTLEQQAGREHSITLFEANDYFGGHTNTVDITLQTAQGPVTHGIDTGFLVLNERTYPNLLRLFDELRVPIAKSDMSFSVSLPDLDLEWSGSNLNTVFAQRRNLLRPSFLRMLRDILRFNALATQLAATAGATGGDASGVAAKADSLSESLGNFLRRHRFSDEFRDWYFLPMAGCIWSCPTSQMLEFPVATMIRFCHNHGLLQVNDRPQWFTVPGGAREYVRRILPHLRDARLQPVRAVRRVPPPDRLLAPTGRPQVEIITAAGAERFDYVVLACHSDQALALLQDATADERAILGAIRYQRNRAVLHTDAGLLPQRRKVWAAWNYTRLLPGGTPASGQDASREDGTHSVCVHYLINRLQPLPEAWQDQPVIVSLNPVSEPRPQHVLREIDYAHPVFDGAAIAAQQRLAGIQGPHQTWFAGAWSGYGFHEDGLKSGLAAAELILARLRSGQPELEAA